MDNQESGIYKRFIGSQEESIPNQNNSKDQAGSLPSVNRIGQTNDQNREPYFSNARYNGETGSSSFDKDQETDVKMKDSFNSSKRQDISKSRNFQSANANESRDYDRNSNSSMTLEKESAPEWMKMVLDPVITNEYFQREWPRISLGAALKKGPGPLSLQNGHHEKSNDKENTAFSQGRTRGTLLLILGGFILVLAISVPIIVITVIMDDDSAQVSTDFYKVNMQLTVNQEFTTDHINTQSITYRNFTRDFCTEIDTIYQATTNTLGSKYEECIVTGLKNGSIIVEFSLYARVSTASEANNTGSILQSSITSNRQSLGPFSVVGSLIIINFEPVNTIPKTVLTETTTIAVTSIQQDISTTQPSISTPETTRTVVIETSSSTEKSTSQEIATSQEPISSPITTDVNIHETTSSVRTTTSEESTSIDSRFSSTQLAFQGTETSTHTTSSPKNDQTSSQINLTTKKTYPDTTLTTDTVLHTQEKTTVGYDNITSTSIDHTLHTTIKATDTMTSTMPQETTTSTTVKDLSTTVKDLTDVTTTTAMNKTTLTAIDGTTSISIDGTTLTSMDGTASTAMGSSLSTGMDRTTSTAIDETSSPVIDETTSLAIDETPSTAKYRTTLTSIDETTTTAMNFKTSTTIDGTTLTTMDGMTPTSMYGTTSTSMDGTTSTAINGVTSKAMDGTTSTVMDGSTSTAMDGTTSTAMDGATSTTKGETTSTAMDKTTSTAMDGATSTAIEGATSTSMDGATPTAMEGTTSTIITSSMISTEQTSNAMTGYSASTVLTSTLEQSSEMSTTSLTEGPSSFSTDTSVINSTSSTTHASNGTAIAIIETSLDTAYSAALSNTSSQAFATFSENFCSEMTTAYSNESVGLGADYSGCQVISIRNGSVIVQFKIYCLRTDVPKSQFKAIIEIYTSVGIFINNERITVLSTTVIDIVSSQQVTTTDKQTADFETTTYFQTSSTESYQNTSVQCKDQTFEIGNHAIFSCNITGDMFHEIEIIRHDNTQLLMATLLSNGTITYEDDVSFMVNYIANQKVELIFNNISCSDEGTYEIYLKENKINQMTSGKINVQKKPSLPQLTMNPDQIIDLQFYRAGSENECSGDIGYPPGELIIEVKYGNGTDYSEIPPLDISFTTNETTPGNCSYFQLLKFGMNYTSDMDNGKIRCRVKSPIPNVDMASEQDLLLIPRDICACNSKTGRVKRGHPKRCEVYVECIDRVYPFGVQCPTDYCRNSINGECSNNCSDAICNEEVPESFCTTAPPPTTTPAPSPYVTCNQSISALLYSEDIMINCLVNSSAQYELINVTKISTQNQEEKVAEIQENGHVVLLSEDSNLLVKYNATILTIILRNVTCSHEGTYRIYVQFPNEIAVAQTGFQVLSAPSGFVELKLNADQIPDIGTFRNWLLHSCTGDVGYPGGDLQIEILINEATHFKKLNYSVVNSDESTENCMTRKTIEFGVKFISEMKDAVIRCGVINNKLSDDVIVYSNNETVALIPSNFCKNATTARSYFQHPSDCTKFVQCEDKTTYGKSCGPNLCFGVNSVDSCDFCSNVLCELSTTQEVTTEQMETSTATDMQSSGISCNDSLSKHLFSEAVTITCFVNSSIGFDFINVTKISTINGEEAIAQVTSTGSINSVMQDDNLHVTFDAFVLTITFDNLTCTDEGTYTFSVQSSSGGVDIASTPMYILQKPSGFAELKLDPDQIADLGSFRSWLPHSCTADVGYPAGELQIEILLNGGDSFSKLNPSIINEVEENRNCSIVKTIKFGIIFTSDMEGAIIRCGVINDKFDEDLMAYSNNETVALIPFDVCENETGSTSYYMHPSDCTKYVQCDGKTTYGKSCGSNLCFGVQSVHSCDWCYNVMCELPTTLELTTEAFEPTTITDDILNGIFCNESISVLILSETVIITCVINSSVSFEFINVTKIPYTKEEEDIAHVTGNGNVNLITRDANLDVNYNAFVLTMTFSIASCSDEANYQFAVKIGEKLAKAKTSIVILQQPVGLAELTLDADQILGLSSIRNWLPHVCTADVGYPAGDLKIEMMLNGQSLFREIVPTIIEDTSTIENCTTRKTLKFGLIFTAEMENAVIRCGVINNKFNDDVTAYSNNETVTLIPNDICTNSNATFIQHPSDCTKYVQCAGTTTYGKSCPQGLCFGVFNTDNCDWCYNVVCDDFCQTANATLNQHPNDCTKYVQCVGTTTYGKSCPSGLCFGADNVDRCDFCNSTICE